MRVFTRRPAAALVASMLLLTGAAACGGSDEVTSLPEAEAPVSDVTPEPTGSPAPAGAPEASFAVALNEQEIVGDIAVIGSTLAVSLPNSMDVTGVSREPSVLAVDATSGSIAWETPIPPPDGGGYAPSQTGLLAADDAFVVPYFALADSAFGSDTDEFMAVAFAPGDGSVLWNKPVRNGAFSVTGNVLLIDDGSTSALDASTGSELWTSDTSTVAAGEGIAISVRNEITGDPVVVDALTGRTLWDPADFYGGSVSRMTPLSHGSGNLLFSLQSATATDGTSTAILVVDARTGRAVGEPVSRDAAALTTVVEASFDEQNSVFVGSGPQAYPFAVDASTGSLLWSLPDAEPGTPLIAVGEGTALLRGDDGDVYPFDTRTGQQGSSLGQTSPAVIVDGYGFDFPSLRRTPLPQTAAQS